MLDTKIMRWTVCASLIAVVAAGGGGGSGTASSTSGSGSSGTATASTMTGTAAIGNALANATVTVTDVNGKTVSATSGVNGAYSVSISGLTAPFIVTAADPSSASGSLYSVVASATAGNGAPVIANVTPLTTAIAALLTADGNPGTLTQSGGASAVTSSAVSAAVAKLNAALATILTANGLSATSFDPIGAAFTPNQTGADAVIDSIKVTPSATGTGLQLASLAALGTAIQLNQSTIVSGPLQAPSQPANYLAALVTALGQCMGGSSSACAGAIDANYVNNGKTSFSARHPGLFATGSSLTGVKTAAFLPAGTLPAISNPAALVYFLFTDANGTPNFASDIVQQRADGSWDIIGNQEQFNVYIASFLGRVQFTNAADASNGRLESGLQIQVPESVTVNGTSTSVGSALVQGAGLPGAGLYMMTPGAGLGPYLTIPATALSAPCTTCSGSGAPNGGMSIQYKWSWVSLTGGTSSWSPNGAAEYAASPIDVSSIAPFSVYTVTMYDMTGSQTGTPVKVLNVAPSMAAAAGVMVPWQTIGSGVIANLLTPGGSLTTVTGNASAVLDWTAPAQAPAYPNFWTSINSLGAPTVSNGVQTYPSQPYNVDNHATPTQNGTTYSETFPRGFVDVLATTATANAEKAVQVQLNWQADGAFFSNTWQYNN